MRFKKEISVFLISLFSYGKIVAQLTVTGAVVDVATKEPIAGANVFISNTSHKTVSNAEGIFYFTNINIQKGELIVNAIGYNFTVINIDNTTPKNISITLLQKPKELDAVVLIPQEKDGYAKWGNAFLKGFLGDTHEAFECSIKNTKDLKFYYNKKTNTLQVLANVPLKIINKALGYEIDYTLEDFEYNIKSRVQFFSGYPVFTNMKGSKSKIKRWQANRTNCYLGSIMHFMRALYVNKLNDENFIVQKAKKTLNKPKADLKEKMKMALLNDNQSFINIDGRDSVNNILMQPDSIFAILTKPLPPDSFAFAIDSVTAGLYFNNYLAISYTKKYNKTLVTSFVKLLMPEAISVYYNGSYYNSMSFFTEQYWAQTEKMARTLPFDYKFIDP